MNFSIITEYPSWFIIFCLLAGAVYAALLYRKSTIANELTPRLLRLLMAFRFLSVSVLCFLLLGPMLRTIMRTVEKPVIILAVDNSQSVIASKDSADRKKAVADMIEKLSGPLQSDFDFRMVTFGDEVKESRTPDYSAKITDFSKLYDELDVEYLNRNVGAVIIASDGIYNSGNSPVKGPARIKAPLFTIALGDTNEFRDLILSGVEHNKTAFLGNSFPIQVRVDARQASGAQTELVVEEEGTVVARRPVTVSGNRYHTMIPVFMDAKTKGLKHYRLSLTPVNGEASLTNNVKDIYIEVVESKQKVLILAQAPHPDISAIRSAIESSSNYEVTLKYAADFNGNATGNNLIILHGLPSANAEFMKYITKWQQENQSLWYILSSSTNINTFNGTTSGINVSNNNGSLNESQAVASPDFSLFTISDELRNAVTSWPPLSTPFGIYKMESNGYSLLTQRIGTVLTGQPLFSFMQSNSGKSAVLCGEGVWKWRMAEFEKDGNDNLFRELIGRTVQYLAASGNKSPFRVQYKNSYMENEQVTFDAELYDASGQLVNTPEVKITITSAEGKQFGYTFSRTDKAYTLNAGLLPSGRYRFKAEAKLGDKLYNETGEFSVAALQLETTNTIADHQLLYAMASRNGGIMVYPGQEQKLLDALKKRGDITAVSYSQKKLIDLVEQPWVFILLILFISIEWFLRKRSGSY
ncbi:MAG: hypothetical protein ABI772_12325 [Bacteroidota bacterium]